MMPGIDGVLGAVRVTVWSVNIKIIQQLDRIARGLHCGWSEAHDRLLDGVKPKRGARFRTQEGVTPTDRSPEPGDWKGRFVSKA